MEKTGKNLYIKEEKMVVDGILPIIIENRQNADYTIHELSRSTPSEPIPCSDEDVVIFFQTLMRGEPTAELIISDIAWQEFGNCVGDAKL